MVMKYKLKVEQNGRNISLLKKDIKLIQKNGFMSSNEDDINLY